MTLYERQTGAFCVQKGWKDMKMKLLTFIGVAGSWIASLFGGWDAALVTLLIFIGIDYVTGLIRSAFSHWYGKPRQRSDLSHNQFP